MTQTIFVYGTLRHLPLLSIVLGRAPADINHSPAQVTGHCVSRVDGHDFPMIRKQANAQASGLLLRDLSDDDVAALNYYEGDFGYDLAQLPVVADGETVIAQVYFPHDGLWHPAEDWSLTKWAAQFGDFTEQLAREKMLSRPQMPKNGVLPAHSEIMMRMRARARMVAAARVGEGQARDLHNDLQVIDYHRAHTDFFAFDQVRLRHRRYDGAMSEPIARGFMMSAEAVVVLIYDPTQDQVLLVEQFRAPVWASGDPNPWIVEAAAGMIDPDETPEIAARREVLEETGIALDDLHLVGRSYASCGSSTEFLHLFVGCADVSKPQKTGGLAAEGEDIRSAIWSYDDLMEWVDAGAVRDGPLLTCALWLARHRDGLRLNA